MKICALCGDMIQEQDETAEHVPPKLFYPKSLRPTIREPFWTVPSHRACNEKYRVDEEYFYYFLMPLVINENSEMGKVLLDDLRERRKNPQTVSMIKWLLSEMKSETPSGIILPPSIRRFSVNQARVQNVALKIAQEKKRGRSSLFRIPTKKSCVLLCRKPRILCSCSIL
jgi:hypothetical protein